MKKLDELGISPAPWTEASFSGWVKDAGGDLVAMTFAVSRAEEEKAVSRLVAAAPDLYEALRLVLASLDAIGFVPTVKEDALARAFSRGVQALEKAGGAE